MDKIKSVYNSRFYERQIDGSLRSARVIMNRLFQIYEPQRIVDVGCGRGAWLKAAIECGAHLAHGFDGPWNDSAQMLDLQISYMSVDLNESIVSKIKYDLAISVEVAEHLMPTSARRFVKSLCALSDVVLFSAAFKSQGGTQHINEQRHSYWGHLFRENGYEVFDHFRPLLWGNNEVVSHYRQNCFLYLKANSSVHDTFVLHGLQKMVDLSFMDCMHPEVFLGENMGVRTHIYNMKYFMPKLFKRLAKR